MNSLRLLSLQFLTVLIIHKSTESALEKDPVNTQTNILYAIVLMEQFLMELIVLTSMNALQVHIYVAKMRIVSINTEVMTAFAKRTLRVMALNARKKSKISKMLQFCQIPCSKCSQDKTLAVKQANPSWRTV